MRAKTARAPRSAKRASPPREKTPATDPRAKVLDAIADVRVRSWMARLLNYGSELDTAPDETETATAPPRPPP
jgi:hypothetical protein